MMAPSLLYEDIRDNGNLDIADNYDYDKVKVVTGDFYNNNNQPDALQQYYPSSKCLQLKLSGEDAVKVENIVSRDNSEVGSRLSYAKDRDPDDERDPPRPLRHPRSNLRRAPSQASMHHTTVPQALKPSTLGSRNGRSQSKYSVLLKLNVCALSRQYYFRAVLSQSSHFRFNFIDCDLRTQTRPHPLLPPPLAALVPGPGPAPVLCISPG